MNGRTPRQGASPAAPGGDAWESALAASDRVATSRHSLLAAAAVGEIRAARIAGRLCLLRADVDAWAGRRHQPTAPSAA